MLTPPVFPCRPEAPGKDTTRRTCRHLSRNTRTGSARFHKYFASQCPARMGHSPVLTVMMRSTPTDPSTASMLGRGGCSLRGVPRRGGRCLPPERGRSRRPGCVLARLWSVLCFSSANFQSICPAASCDIHANAHQMSPQDRAYGRSGVTGRRIVPMPALLSRSPAISPVRGRPRERSLSPVARAVPERSAPHPSGRNSPRQTSPSRALSGPANHMSQFWVSPTPDEGVDRRISPGKQRTMSPAARSLGIVSRSNSPLRAVPEDKIAEPTPFSNHAVRVLHSPRRAVRTAPTAEDPGRMISQITGTTDSDEFRSGANTLERADEAMEAMAELLEVNIGVVSLHQMIFSARE
jgi:hypothetical protein